MLLIVSLKMYVTAFRRSTIDELWDSSEELIANYQKESEYQKLLDGKAGINVSVSLSSLSQWSVA